MPYNEGTAVKYRILWSKEFEGWYLAQTVRTQTLIDGRLDRIKNDGHFGFTNRFDGLIELKWISGLRIYTFTIENAVVVILNGGNKNGQQADIRQAQKIKKGWVHGIPCE
jgi:putative addiction module killer protein